MLASLSCAPGGWLAVIGRAASPSEKTARPHIVSRLQDKVKRPLRCCPTCAPPAPGTVLLGTARSWRGILPLTHLATGGAYDSHHRTAGIADCPRRRGSVATRGKRAAAGDAKGRRPVQQV